MTICEREMRRVELFVIREENNENEELRKERERERKKIGVKEEE